MRLKTRLPHWDDLGLPGAALSCSPSFYRALQAGLYRKARRAPQWRPRTWHSSPGPSHTPAPHRVTPRRGLWRSSPSSPGPGRQLTSCPPRRRGSPRWPAAACAGVASYTHPGPSSRSFVAQAQQNCARGWGLSAEGRAWTGTQESSGVPGRQWEELCRPLARGLLLYGAVESERTEKVLRISPASLQSGEISPILKMRKLRLRRAMNLVGETVIYWSPGPESGSASSCNPSVCV